MFRVSLAAILLIVGCSPAKFIGRTAQNLVLKDSALVNAHVGISIYDVQKGEYLYRYQGDKYFVPASNTKIPTCYAAMKYLGDSLTAFRYNISEDTVYIQPAGDPSFLHSDFSQQRAFQFLRRFTSVVITPAVRNNFRPYGSGWAWNDYQENYMAPRAAFPMYGNVARFRLLGDSVIAVPQAFGKKVQSSATGFSLKRNFDSNRFDILPGIRKEISMPFLSLHADAILADTLHNNVLISANNSVEFPFSFHSVPTDSLLKLMMHRSDNFFAEQSLLMVSQELLGYISDGAITDTLLKILLSNLPQKPRWADGSGLSRYNLFTPNDFVVMLSAMRKDFGMERLKTIFATGGEGTLNNYYTDLQGRIFAKTGTLSGVVALSGFLYTQHNKLLTFSVLVNNHNASSAAVRRAVEKLIREVAAKY